MSRSRLLFAGCLAISFFALRGDVMRAAEEEYPAFMTASEAGPDYQVQGEYVGEIKDDDDAHKVGVQVIALGDGAFEAVAYPGGLPGDGWNKSAGTHKFPGKTEGDVTVFKGDDGEGRLSGGVITAKNAEGEKIGELKRVERKSPTLGAKPPAGAIVLFDGSSTDTWNDAHMTDDGLLAGGCTSKQKFGDFTLHLEFQTPFMPTARKQYRGNSGVYQQDRYEIQILDSFGLAGENDECGGYYKIKAPDVNMCFPPLAWQTYDIEFTAPRFDDSGKKTQDATVTALHNGVVIHEKLKLSHPTPGRETKEAATGPLHLQDHGNPVRFRNVWIVEKDT